VSEAGHAWVAPAPSRARGRALLLASSVSCLTAAVLGCSAPEPTAGLVAWVLVLGVTSLVLVHSAGRPPLSAPLRCTAQGRILVRLSDEADGAPVECVAEQVTHRRLVLRTVAGSRIIVWRDTVTATFYRRAAAAGRWVGPARPDRRPGSA